jgi:Cys-Gly metallodipeptidase DUG1
MNQISTYINDHQQEFIDKLRQAVAIPSVSGDFRLRSQVVEMASWLADQMTKLDIT